MVVPFQTSSCNIGLPFLSASQQLFRHFLIYQNFINVNFDGIFFNNFIQDSSLVGQVEAIDNDTGPDGEVFYYFVGASNNAGFQIDKKTGVITVKGNLDRESQNRYVLTVLAKNKGSIKGMFIF